MRRPREEPEPGDTEPDEGTTRSQRKRDMQDLQVLGERLSRLRPDQVRALPVEGRLVEALLSLQKMGPSEHRRRQLQLVGRLMRDEDVALVSAASTSAGAATEAEEAAFRDLEDWRTRLIAEGDAALGEALAAFPNAEAPPLRQLIRDARREREQGKPPGSARRLFQYLRRSR